MNLVRKQLARGIPPEKLEYPDGRCPSGGRHFESVVDDIRHATYAVIRIRPDGKGAFDATALGSGFFVSKKAFLTCNHVVNDRRNPHRDGDLYRLVNSLLVTESEIAGRSLDIPNTKTGTDIHFYPESDCAILVQETGLPQRYVAIDYGHIDPGREIGIAGYPLPALQIVEQNGQRTLGPQGLIYRVAKGIVASTFVTNLDLPATGLLSAVPVIEVNFLFVPGNSGGPIFDASTGRVLGFVQSFRTNRVDRRLIAGPFPDLDAIAPSSYVETAHAIYSLGFRMIRVKQILEALGVKGG